MDYLLRLVMAEQQFLVPLDQYLKVGLHIGTKFRTKYMEQFIYKIRPDGLAVLNVQKIDERIRVGTKFISQYAPEDILIVCRRDSGHKAVDMFSKLTGVRVIKGRYPPGALTNSQLDTFTEAKLLIVIDPWPDKNAVLDAVKVGIPIIALCDTNNESNYLDLVIPCNNKGKKSLGLLFYILTKEYMKNRGLISSDSDFSGNVLDFSDEE